MKQISVIVLLSGVCCLPFLIIGCSGQKLPSDMPRLYPTVITVMQDGKPIADALVVLVNADPAIAWSCIARTDSSGRATMQTNGMYAGAPAGTYKATVVKQEISGGSSDIYAGAPDPAVDQEAYQGWLMQNEARIAAAERKGPVVHDLVDPKFADAETSPLEVTITTGRNAHTLDIGAAFRELVRERPR